MQHSRLFAATVVHTRYTPVHHSFNYPVYYYIFDLDELEGLSKSVRKQTNPEESRIAPTAADVGTDLGVGFRISNRFELITKLCLFLRTHSFSCVFCLRPLLPRRGRPDLGLFVLFLTSLHIAALFIWL